MYKPFVTFINTHSFSAVCDLRELLRRQHSLTSHRRRIFVSVFDAVPLRKDESKSRWSGGSAVAFADQVQNVVLLGYTLFSVRDARVAAKRMMEHGPIRLKKPLSVGGRAQKAVSCAEKMDAFLEQSAREEIAASGLVLELRQVVTYISVRKATPNSILCPSPAPSRRRGRSR